MHDYRNCFSSSNPSAVALWNKICDESESAEREWIAKLRADGFKAAHPNDGWVDREKKQIQLTYPQFDDGVDVGDKVMLGWPWKDGNLRPVRLVVRLSDTIGCCKVFLFEDL